MYIPKIQQNLCGSLIVTTDKRKEGQKSYECVASFDSIGSKIVRKLDISSFYFLSNKAEVTEMRVINRKWKCFTCILVFVLILLFIICSGIWSHIFLIYNQPFQRLPLVSYSFTHDTHWFANKRITIQECTITYVLCILCWIKAKRQFQQILN